MPPLRPALAAAAREALALFVPVSCVGCGEPDASVCDRCAAAMSGPVLRQDLAAGFPAWAGTEYTGVARRAILALKNDGRTDATGALARPLAAALDAAVADLSTPSPAPGTVALAAVPSTRAAYRRRGYRPIDVLVRPTRIRLEHPLGWGRQPADQIGLGREARQANLAGSLRAGLAVSGRCFLLVDDVVTTGGTLREARRAITEAGGVVVGAAVVAATQRRILPASEAANLLSDLSADRDYGGG